MTVMSARIDKDRLDTPAQLRARAVRCRELARNAFSDAVARELLAIAAQYEHEANVADQPADDVRKPT